MTGASAGPLQRVLAAFSEGAGTLGEVAMRTGLDPDMVDASVAHLRRMGRIDVRELSMGCPSGGCGTCASGCADATPGCRVPGPSATRGGPVLVRLSVRRAS